MRVNNVKSLIAPIVIVLFGVLAMNKLSSLRQEVPARPAETQARVVNTRSISPADIEARLVTWGRLNSAQPLVLLSEAEGALMRGDIAFQPGQSFERDQLLLRVDDRQKRLELSRNKSDFINAMAGVLPDIQQQYPKEWSQWNNYFKQLQVDKPLPKLPAAKVERIKRLLARNNAYQLYYAVRIQEIALAKYQVRAPFDGTILSADMRAGANVRAGTRLGEILNLEQLDLVLQLPASELPWLEPQGEVIVASSQFDGIWHGRIDRIGRNVDNATQTTAVYVRLLQGESPLPIMAGLLFEAQLPGKTIADAVSVPLRNLYSGDQVYVLAAGKLEKRAVTVVRREAEQAIVSAGLAPGDELVTDLLEGVAPGMKAMSVEQFEQQAETP